MNSNLSENDDDTEDPRPLPGDPRAVARLSLAVGILTDQLVVAGVIGPATSEKVRALLSDEETM